jgi:hypothetical protein
MMEARKSPMERVSFAMPDHRARLDQSRVFSSKAGSNSGHNEKGSAFGARFNRTRAMPLAQRNAGIGASPSADEAGGRNSMIDQLTELIGLEGASRMVKAYGGTRIYVPHTPEPEDTLSESIGHLAACALARMYGGERIEVPNPPPRRLRILELRTTGLSIDAIARSLGCTRRRVFQVMAEARVVASER